MPQLDLKPRVEKFIKTLPPKHQRQVKSAILSLQEIPKPHDSCKLVGYENFIRIDVGEYRVVYEHDLKKDLITVLVVGHRNDGEVYRVAKRILR